ncbi:MAG: EAL domain-containing protein [Undibacterium sp.]|nr:EAL domain-containing protein [Undibacterium sp.]
MSDAKLPASTLPDNRADHIGHVTSGFNHLMETSEQREILLKQILDTSSVAIFVVDMEGRITQANQRMAEMFDVPLSALNGSEYVNLVHPAERESGRKLMLDLLSSAIHSVELDRLYWRSDHTQFWGQLTGRRFYDINGNNCGLVGVIADISERKETEQALLKSKQQYDNLVSKIPVGIYTLRSTPAATYALDYASPMMADILNISVENLQADGRAIFDAIHPDDLAQFIQLNQIGLQQRTPFDWKGRILHEAIVKWVHIASSPEPLENGDVLWHGIVVDITERKLTEENLLLAASVFTHAREGIMITAEDGKIIEVNDTFSRITGYGRDEVLGENPRILSSGRQGKEFYVSLWHDLIAHGYWYGEVWNRRKNGEVYAEMQTISAVKDAGGKTTQYVSLFSDITALKEHEKQLEHIAHYDALTGLPNRVLLADRLHQAMSQAQRRGKRLAVAYLDLDGFKAINDQNGHHAGDQLLIALANNMKNALREGDTFARLGGDEFVAVLTDLSEVSASVPMLTRLLAAAAQAVPFGDSMLRVSASLGVTFFPQLDEVDADQLLRQADQAMYHAKLAGKNHYHVFDAEQDRSVRDHHESLERIRLALNAQEFVLYYQPKVNMRTGEVIGAEALIRWQHPEQGLLAPALFLPAIEDHPLAVELGEWVIDTALTQIELWRAAGLTIAVSVNVGARQLQQADFVERLKLILARHPNIKPSELELEVLETSALEDLARASHAINACHDIGVKFSLDDFGTGYSSLTYLKRLPVAQLKIDQSFVRDMLDDPDDLAILEGVIGMAAAFRRDVIAEGVETIEHGEMLLQLGCELAQGYGIARPMPAGQLPGWAAAWRPDAAWVNVSAVSRDDLPLLFASVEHRAWITAIAHYLEAKKEAPTQLAHHQCRLGVWLHTTGLNQYGEQASFHAIELLHRQAHAMADELLDLQAQGNNALALAKLQELHGLGDALFERIKPLLHKAKNGHTPNT